MNNDRKELLAEIDVLRIEWLRIFGKTDALEKERDKYITLYNECMDLKIEYRHGRDNLLADLEISKIKGSK